MLEGVEECLIYMCVLCCLVDDLGVSCWITPGMSNGAIQDFLGSQMENSMFNGMNRCLMAMLSDQ